jgi:manganese/zinc/iron transport system permease protein
MLENFVEIDLAPLLVAILCSISCALTGSFLILRKQALMGDALSHIVLPGIVMAFIITGQILSFYMITGALISCLLAVLLIEFIKKTAEIEPGAAMGTVFTSMFAIGVILLEQKVGTRVHLDVHHALYGAIELVYWPELNISSLTKFEALENIPQQILTLLSVNILVLFLLIAFYKELKLSTFDSQFCQFTGLSTSLINLAFLSICAVCAVAAFEAVGCILVIAMFICPAATARLLTDKLSTQLFLATLIGITSAITGYMMAAHAPLIFRTEGSLSAAGMIALTAGLLQMVAIVIAPRYGFIARNKSGK